MKKSFWIMITSFLLVVSNNYAQKPPLDFSVYDKWNYIEDYQIANNGKWMFYEQAPYKGDGATMLCQVKSANKIARFPRGTNASFSPSSKFLVYVIKPYTDTIRNLKLADTPKKELPKDSLGIYVFENNQYYKIPEYKKFRLPKEEGQWMVYLYKKQEEETTKDSSKTEEKKEKPKTFDKNAPKTYHLDIFNPVNGNKHTFKNVSEVTLSEDGKRVGFISLQNDTLLKSTLHLFDTQKQEDKIIYENTGLIKKVTLDHKKGQLAFLHSTDSIKEKAYSLYFIKDVKITARLLVDTMTSPFKTNWTASLNGRIKFSENDERLFFGVAPKPEPEPKDTLLESEKVHVDIWSWQDPLLQPEQLENVKREKKRTYLSVYHIQQDKLVQLEDEDLLDVKLVADGDFDLALGTDEQPYMRRQSWEMPPYADYYLIDITTGKRKQVKKEIQSYFNISPAGKYLYWYENADSSWYTFDIKTKATRLLSKGLNVNLYDEEHDYPSDPSPYYFAGWTHDDEYFWVYDKYDIWQLDPTGKEKPVCLTAQYGRNNKITFRHIELHSDLEYISTKEDIILSGFNNKTKASGYYKLNIKRATAPEALLTGDFRYYTPKKAKDVDQLIWKKSSVSVFPNVYSSTLNFNDINQLSDANPQQSDYNWTTVELVKWTTTEGTTEEGLLYKPENFDPNKKYPMMVYFYRLSADGLHNHRVPKPSRSVINPTFYASNGYLVFIPNIRYKEGYPGESAYNYIVSGTLSLVNSRKYIDKDHMALQGQSWGGYQVAYLITKTDMFAAASAGAPVSNMTSAYGGIRWGTGMSRMFQYEETQSRIGGTLWEKPLNYIENSPVFYAPKVNTPLLIRHNDGDGAVPWYQGIEYFVALRRLNKPVWMLNYNGAPHNERAKSPNTKDLSIRMMQFFNHYLKGDPAPRWMIEGIPATKKGKTMGYELMD